MAKKRVNHEGTIFQRNNGTWRAQLTLNGQRLSFSGKSQRECRDWIKATQQKIDAGLSFEGAQTSLENFLSDWLVTIKSSLRVRTCTQYEQIVRDHINPQLGQIKLFDLRPEHIQKLYNAHLKAGIGPRTVQLTHAVLRRALVHAVKLGLLERNPAAATVPPRPKPAEMKILDERQVSLFLSAAKESRNEALYCLALTTGMRQSELLGLQWADLDWTKKTLKIQRQLKRKRGGGFNYLTPKTKAGKRTITLGSKTIETLRAQVNHQATERLVAGERWQEHNLLFPSTIGTPMDQKHLHRDFKAILVRGGLPDIRFHDLRHTAISIMLNHNVPLIAVSRRVGHSRPSITLDIYGHLIPGMQGEVAEGIDDLVLPTAVELHQGCTNEESLLNEQAFETPHMGV